MGKKSVMSDIEDKRVLFKEVEAALEDIRPYLAVDGGDVELVDITDDQLVQVRWLGACSTCNMTAMTMQAGIEQSIKNKVAGITGVEAVNDPSN